MASPQLPSARPFIRARRDRRLRVLVAGAALAVVGAIVPAGASPTDAACGSFQSRVNNASSGSTITIPKCTFHESVTIKKRLTIKAYGAVIDGENVRSRGIAVLASDVKIYGLTVTRIASAEYGGAVWTTGVSRFEFRDGIARNSKTICVSLNGGSGHRIVDSELTNCGKEGFYTNAVRDVMFARNDIHHNNTNLAYNPGWEGGGGKSANSDYVTFWKNKVHDNGGPGIWFDVGSTHGKAKYNNVYRNTHAGIFFEVGRSASIYGNRVWKNGHTGAAWGYGAGIQVSSSDYVKVYDNIVAWNSRGISVISQARGPSPHNDNVVHDNVIVSKGGKYVAGWYDDHGGSLWHSGNDNRGYDNRYWIAASSPSYERFVWNGSRSTLSAYNATLGERSGSYISRAKRDAILSNAHIPLSP